MCKAGKDLLPVGRKLCDPQKRSGGFPPPDMLRGSQYVQRRKTL